jgi:hypothetical protein
MFSYTETKNTVSASKLSLVKAVCRDLILPISGCCHGSWQAAFRGDCITGNDGGLPQAITFFQGNLQEHSIMLIKISI